MNLIEPAQSAPTGLAAGTPRPWWARHAGDFLAAGVVLVAGGLLGSTFFPGPEFFGPPAAPPGMPPPQPDAIGPRSLDSAFHFGSSQFGGLLLLLAAAALMFVRRRWPALVFGAALTLFAAVSLLGLPSLGPGIAAIIAAYSFAFHVSRRSALIAVGASVAAIIVLAFAVTQWETLSTHVFQIGAGVAIAAAIGDSARSRHIYLVQTEDRALRAEQTREAEARRRVSEERLRLARDLHDTVAHQISVINLHAGAASGYVTTNPERAQEALSTIRQAARGALSEIGDLLHYLRDEDSARTELSQHALVDLEALITRLREAGMTIITTTNGDVGRVTGTTSTTAYRVIQEGLTNAHKHGAGGPVLLNLTVDAAQLEIVLTNSLPPTAARGDAEFGTGLGLIGIRERVAASHGQVKVTRDDGHYRLEVTMPLRRKAGLAQ